MKISIWGSRGSIASAGPDTVRYGGNTACVSVLGTTARSSSSMREPGSAASGPALPDQSTVHVLLTHLHMDHIQGLGFFGPFFEGHRQIHVWGPPSTTEDLRTRLTRYLSPPLFPVRLRDLDSAGGAARRADALVEHRAVRGHRRERHPSRARPSAIGSPRTATRSAYLPGSRAGARRADRVTRSGRPAAPRRRASTCCCTTRSTRLPNTSTASAGATAASAGRRGSPNWPGRRGSRPSITTRHTTTTRSTRCLRRPGHWRVGPRSWRRAKA